MIFGIIVLNNARNCNDNGTVVTSVLVAPLNASLFFLRIIIEIMIEQVDSVSCV